MPDVITIDGPSASGKSSVARRVAAELGLPYVSSGLIYRGVTHQVKRYGIDPDDEAAIVRMLGQHPVQLVPLPEGNRLLAEGQDVSEQMHTLEIDQAVSAVARHPEVRAYVYRSLRALQPPFVVEGRDMGSTVFPDAALKFYLTATPEVRARRRVGEREADYATVLAELIRRDAADAKQIPPAPDAIIIDTSELGLEEVVQAILERVRRAGVKIP
jgi:cytidylate kinase